MKNRNLIIALFVLVALNVISLGFLWYTNRHHIDRLPGRQSADANFELFREIDFTEEQERSFRRLSLEHRKSMRPKFMQMSELRSALFAGSERLSDEERDRLLNELSSLQRTADSLTYVHFRSVYQLCNPEQKRKMDVFIHQMVNRDRRGNTRPK
tara:strand:+ start:74745 stop:75209 length:465 start_codon:yes stop_codon:yes gene_type:complete